MQHSCETGGLTSASPPPSPKTSSRLNTILPPETAESVPNLVSRAGAHRLPITWCGNSCFLIRASDDLVEAAVLLFLQSCSLARPALSLWAFSWLHFKSSMTFLC